MSQATKENVVHESLFLQINCLGGFRGQGSFDKGLGRPELHEI